MNTMTDEQDLQQKEIDSTTEQPDLYKLVPVIKQDSEGLLYIDVEYHKYIK